MYQEKRFALGKGDSHSLTIELSWTDHHHSQQQEIEKSKRDKLQYQHTVLFPFFCFFFVFFLFSRAKKKQFSLQLFPQTFA